MFVGWLATGVRMFLMYTRTVINSLYKAQKEKQPSSVDGVRTPSTHHTDRPSGDVVKQATA